MFEAGIEATAWARTSTLRLRLDQSTYLFICLSLRFCIRYTFSFPEAYLFMVIWFNSFAVITYYVRSIKIVFFSWWGAEHRENIGTFSSRKFRSKQTFDAGKQVFLELELERIWLASKISSKIFSWYTQEKEVLILTIGCDVMQ